MDTSLFVLRRAWLLGRCRRADVNQAFDTFSSPNRASKILQDAVGRWSAALLWVPNRGVFPRREVDCPPEARAQTVLDLLARGASPIEVGLLPGEPGSVPFLRPDPKPSRALNEAATRLVLAAALRQTPLEVLYVGLRRGERARWRRLWPRAMECDGLHWRLHAQDLDDTKSGYPIKTFLLARILDARATPRPAWPEDFQRRSVVRHEVRLRVHLSEELTEDQRVAVSNQFDIRDGTMSWPQVALYAFERQFTNRSVSPDVVWPVVTHVEEVR